MLAGKDKDVHHFFGLCVYMEATPFRYHFFFANSLQDCFTIPAGIPYLT